MTVEIEGDITLGEVSVMTIEVDKGKEASHQEGMATEGMTAQMLEVDQIQELP